MSAGMSIRQDVVDVLGPAADGDGLAELRAFLDVDEWPDDNPGLSLVMIGAMLRGTSPQLLARLCRRLVGRSESDRVYLTTNLQMHCLREFGLCWANRDYSLPPAHLDIPSDWPASIDALVCSSPFWSEVFSEELCVSFEMYDSSALSQWWHGVQTPGERVPRVDAHLVRFAQFVGVPFYSNPATALSRPDVQTCLSWSIGHLFVAGAVHARIVHICCSALLSVLRESLSS